MRTKQDEQDIICEVGESLMCEQAIGETHSQADAVEPIGQRAIVHRQQNEPSPCLVAPRMSFLVKTRVIKQQRDGIPEDSCGAT